MTSQRPDHPPAEPDPEAHTREVDRAALLGAALAAVVALTFGGQGEWDYLAAAAGVALLAVLGAFFRLPRGRGRAGELAEVAAMSAVAALAAALVVAAPMQAVLAAGTPAGKACRAGAAVSAGFVLIDGQQRHAATLAAERLAGEGATITAAEALVHAAEHERRTVLGVCLGALTSRWLPLPALAIGLTIFGIAGWRLRRCNPT